MNIGKVVKYTIGILGAAYLINFGVQANKMNQTKYLDNLTEFMERARPVMMDIADDIGFQAYLKAKCLFNKDFKNDLNHLKGLAEKIESAEPEFEKYLNKMFWPFYSPPKLNVLTESLLNK